jgi:putative endonuclease
MYKVYILFSLKLKRFYVGYTNDIERRILEHNRIKGKYTDAGIPWELIYLEDYATKEEAMAREKFIKSKKSKSYILSLMNSVGS